MLNIAMANLMKMLKDVKAIIGILIAPILIMFLFSLMGSPDSRTIEIGITNNTDSSKSSYVVERLEQDRNVSVNILEEEELREKIKSEKISAGIIITGGEKAEYQILKADENAYMVIKNKVNSILKQSDLIGEKKVNDNNSLVNYKDNYKPNSKIFVIGFIINFMMFSMIYMINELTELKKNNVLRRSCTCPHTNIQLLGGIMLSMFVLIFIQFILVNIMGLILFKELLFSSIIVSVAAFVPFIMLILGLGLLISRLCKNPDLSPVIANMIVMPLGLISGTFLPKEMLPDFLQKFAFLSPQFWVINTLENGSDIISALPSVIILSIMALCILAASSYNFKSYLKN